jgi:acetolactate synthase-1/2/3 large subunit
MNGAEALLRTLVAAGIDTCFSNPGTSEMHFIGALDRVDGMRGVPVLAEGVATGAADGYARMARRPAATLLHCGPGLANGIANLHNARRARSPVVNLIGDLSQAHRPHDPPLASDIEALAGTVSGWTRTSRDVHAVAGDGAAAVAAAQARREIASLVLPSDVCWSEGGSPAVPLAAEPGMPVDASAIAQACCEWLRDGVGTVLLLGGDALLQPALSWVAAIAQRTGARLVAESSITRSERGRGRPDVQRIPYAPALAVQALKDARRVVLAGARSPVFSFAGPDGRSSPLAAGTQVHVLADPAQDVAGALRQVADALACAPWQPDHTAAPPTSLARGAATPEAFAESLAALLPAQAIVVDEGVSFGRAVYGRMGTAAPHDWMQLTGGAIGCGMPLATGAAIAAPGRRVVNLEADGSALYTVQALWTQAREQLDVTTVIFSNRRYAILFEEMARVGAGMGRRAHDLLSLDRPAIDWVRLAEGLGVPAERAPTMEAFNNAFAGAVQRRGPHLIELVI